MKQEELGKREKGKEVEKEGILWLIVITRRQEREHEDASNDDGRRETESEDRGKEKYTPVVRSQEGSNIHSNIHAISSPKMVMTKKKFRLQKNSVYEVGRLKQSFVHIEKDTTVSRRHLTIQVMCS